jgi:7-carboxy-7-deazaguanine synthase
MWRGVARPREGELLVSEVFGPTLQGEGPNTGQTAAFIRLGSCNLSCRWCDTAFTWDQNRYDLARELRVSRTQDVAAEALALSPRLVILTGGEPGLQAGEAARLMRILGAAGCRVEVETSGTVPLGAMVDATALLVVSPKLSNAGMRPEARLRWNVLHSLAALPQTVFKFVVADADELTEVDAVAERLSLRSSKVWIMPEATERDVLLQRMALLAGPVAERGWSLSNRLQVLLWGNERGHLRMGGRGNTN